MGEPSRLPRPTDPVMLETPAGLRILVAIDDPVASATAVLESVRFAQAAHAELLFLHVTAPTAPNLPSFGAQVYESQEEHARIAAESETRSLSAASAAATAANVPFRIVHEQDRQGYRGILRASRKHGCTTIVVSCRSRGAGSAYMMGSQIRQLLIHSATPVLVFAADLHD
jgi:nucleotide-binding universal stress UspA family protein